MPSCTTLLPSAKQNTMHILDRATRSTPTRQRDHREKPRSQKKPLHPRLPCPTPGEYVMLSPRGGRSHDPTASSSPSPPSSSSTRHTDMEDDDDAGRAGACGRVLEWERGLPREEELTPLSHPLIPPALAAAFRLDVRGTGSTTAFPSTAFDCPVLALNSPTSHLSFRRDDEDEDDEEEEEGEGESEDATSGIGGGGSCRGGSRAGKKARMVWTPELHHRFVEAVAHLGDKGAVPKAIVRLMNVDGLTRENVASHLQKYRIYLKRTRSPAEPQQPPLAFPPAYGSHFRPQQPCDASSRGDYFAFSSRDS